MRSLMHHVRGEVRVIERVFDNIPEAELRGINAPPQADGGWQNYFKHLGENARVTTWGMKESERWILGLLVQLEESLVREEKLTEVFNKNKGLQMENGRLRKQCGEANDRAVAAKKETKRYVAEVVDLKIRLSEPPKKEGEL